jgi:hypothetical protein
VTVPTPEWDAEFGNVVWKAGSASSQIKLVPRSAQTSLFFTAVNTDGSATFPANYTSFGGIGSVGIAAALKTAAAAPADADFSGATPVVPAPPVGTMIYNTNTHKLYVRDAAASWLSTVAFT